MRALWSPLLTGDRFSTALPIRSWVDLPHTSNSSVRVSYLLHLCALILSIEFRAMGCRHRHRNDRLRRSRRSGPLHSEPTTWLEKTSAYIKQRDTKSPLAVRRTICWSVRHPLRWSPRLVVPCRFHALASATRTSALHCLDIIFTGGGSMRSGRSGCSGRSRRADLQRSNRFMTHANTLYFPTYRSQYGGGHQILTFGARN